MLVALHRDVKDHWHLMPELLTRAENFAVAYDSDANPQDLVDIIVSHFTSRSDKMLILVALTNGEIAAHLIASIDTWCGAKYATVLQYEATKGKMSLEDRQVGFLILQKWAKYHGASLQILARNDRMAKLFSKYWGFAKVRTLMRRRVD
jgi:hypothetical protein